MSAPKGLNGMRVGKDIGKLMGRRISSDREAKKPMVFTVNVNWKKIEVKLLSSCVVIRLDKKGRFIRTSHFLTISSSPSPFHFLFPQSDALQ